MADRLWSGAPHSGEALRTVVRRSSWDREDLGSVRFPTQVKRVQTICQTADGAGAEQFDGLTTGQRADEAGAK